MKQVEECGYPKCPRPATWRIVGHAPPWRKRTACDFHVVPLLFPEGSTVKRAESQTRQAEWRLR